ncbi:FAD-binding oxidoreductase [Pseudonocardia sp. KRD-184]|uniref:FAD-binding oxidoreductase n=1 Tax=Pseudonocardia oceani TaxID=2792013 RepID=A0ABS6U985_9PSEU|nr:FAD-binding oxidoreductase [Pseudonocardia oceani]MBW0098954.1 FAD-binding oxidoreductase [Pseudonocardia oceani]MBW0109393.1 FAD-binding oxidoreductase [Pseudonocardia oceani]MBW0123600.1 FAD-binding oxidoreductase [Pseudonocardia oceani]MBW0128796.1 FAD-binding oxidoreductase [Pseudonocardia oceani]
MPNTSLRGWGRTAPTRANVVPVRSAADLTEALAAAGPRGVIARGLGRSYGDPAQNGGGTVLDMTGLSRIHSVDADSGRVVVDAGVSLDTLMRAALPFGLWLPVLPGTRQVTVGGAIGADIHGKAHHVVGSFGNHVESLDLVTADGRAHTLTPDDELFWATVGGMGLTGVVVRAVLRLHHVETAYFRVDTEQIDNLDDLMARQSVGDEEYAETVSWFDAVTTGPHMGRGLLMRANHATLDDLPPTLRRHPLRFDAPQLLTVPDVFPPGLLNRVTARLFSELWYRKSPTKLGAIQNITQFLHPLDILGEWNRGYGPRGFLQYQFVVPLERGDVVRSVLEEMVRAKQVSALNVLKRFGEGNRAPLSFPKPGWTLCVDIPVGDGLGPLCDALDELVLDAGGRHYLAKESRTTPEAIRRGYPRLDEWRTVRDAADPTGVFTSDMSRRLELTS